MTLSKLAAIVALLLAGIAASVLSYLESRSLVELRPELLLPAPAVPVESSGPEAEDAEEAPECDSARPLAGIAATRRSECSAAGALEEPASAQRRAVPPEPRPPARRGRDS